MDSTCDDAYTTYWTNGPVSSGEGGAPSTLSEYAGWYFWVYVLVGLLRGECSTQGWGGWLSTHWVGGEEGGFKKKCERGAA